jgi:hypothetical protein
MKIVLDITKLVEDGRITPAEAERLKSFAAAETGSLAINIVLSLGVVAIVAGAVALKPSAVLGMFLGAAMVAAGFAISYAWTAQWGLLGAANIMVGTLAVSAGLVIELEGNLVSTLGVFLLLLAVGWTARSGFLVALAPFALAGALGSSTGYLHAAYFLVINEATILIGVFTAAAVAAYQIAKIVDAVRSRLALLFARVSLVLVNFGFWVGSLHGDRPGATWRLAEYAGSGRRPSAVALPSLNEMFWIPDVAFVVAWALALIAAGVWGARQNRRFVVNTVATFASIHFYTQWFERLGANAVSVLISGVATVAIAIALWRYNQRSTARPDRRNWVETSP